MCQFKAGHIVFGVRLRAVEQAVRLCPCHRFRTFAVTCRFGRTCNTVQNYGKRFVCDVFTRRECIGTDTAHVAVLLTIGDLVIIRMIDCDVCVRVFVIALTVLYSYTDGLFLSIKGRKYKRKLVQTGSKRMSSIGVVGVFVCSDPIPRNRSKPYVGKRCIKTQRNIVFPLQGS